MVFIVLMVSTSVCGTDSMGSNPINHPKCPYGGIGIRSGLRSHNLQVRLLLRVQKVKNKYIEIIVILKNFLYICISSLEDGNARLD